jgi:hypothetical protein
MFAIREMSDKLKASDKDLKRKRVEEPKHTVVATGSESKRSKMDSSASDKGSEASKESHRHDSKKEEKAVGAKKHKVDSILLFAFR